MTTSNEPATDDEFWRRPATPTESTDPGPPSSAKPVYSGPPSAAPPTRNWRPPLIMQPAPPRQLPVQDHDRIDAEERGARTVTYGVGMIAGAVLLVVTCLLCARVVF